MAKPGPPRTRTHCVACGVERNEKFIGPRCHDCNNAWRRARYRYDPHYRASQIASRRDSYDREKHRIYMRHYRARKQAELEADDSSHDSPPNASERA